MLGRLTLTMMALVAAGTLLGGCKKAPDCGKEPGCRYVYERRVEAVPPVPVPDKVDHVMILLSATGRNMTNSHCAALFCKVKQDKSVESVTISWMPVSSSKKTPLFLKNNYVEDGTNLDIPSTLAWARSMGATVDRHGPYYIREDLYNRAKAQHEKLIGGGVKFKIVDSPASRQTSATNSIHAISDILCNGDQFDKFLLTGGNHGRDASSILKVYFEREGYIESRYRNETELLREFNLQSVRRLD